MSAASSVSTGQKLRLSRAATGSISSAAKRQKVESKKSGPTGAPIVMKPEHAVAVDGKRMYQSEVMTPQPNQKALANTSPFSFIIENDAAQKIKDMCLRFQIECVSSGSVTGDGGVTLLPTPYWVDRIEWYDRHTNREIARYHGDALWMFLMTLNQDVQEILADSVGYNPNSKKEGSYFQKVTEIKNWFLPFPHNWADGFDLDMSQLRGDLELKIYPSGNIICQGFGATRIPVTSSGNDNINLREVRLVSCSELETQVARLQDRQFRAMKTLQHNFLSVQQFTDAGRQITAGSTFTVDLDQFHHEAAALAIMIRDSTLLAAGGNARLNLISLGPKGTVDHENVHGRSLFGDGTPLDLAYMRRYVAATLFPQKYVNHNSIYIIPFAHCGRSLFSGQMDGWHPLRGERERIRFVPDAVGVEAVYTLGQNLAAATNSYQIEYKGCRTSLLAFDAIAATINAAVNVLPSVIDEDLKFTFSAALSDGKTPTYNVTDRADNPINTAGRAFLNFIDCQTLGSNVPWRVSVVLTTAGVPGFGISGAAPGSSSNGATGTYQIDVYSLFHRQIQQTDGRLEPEDL